MSNEFDQYTSGNPRTEAPADIPRITVTPAAPPANEFDVSAGGGSLPKPPETPPLNKVFGELKPADVTPTQQAKWNVMNVLNWMGMNRLNAQHGGDALINTLGISPLGTVFSAADLSHDLPRGNYGAAALDVLGMAPLFRARQMFRPAEVRPAELPTFRRGDYAAGRSPYIDDPRNVAGLPEGGASAARRREFEARTPGMQPAQLPESLQEAGRAGYRFSERSPVVYHSDAMGDATQQIRMLTESPHHGAVTAGAESAPQLYALLAEFDRGFPRGGMRAVTPSDFDALRQRLMSITEGKDGAAARQAAHALEAYMLNPPPGSLRRGTPQDLTDLRDAFAQGRGNWRALRTGETVQDAIDYAHQALASINSGKNVNKVKQAVNKYVASDAGQAKLFGATPQEIGQLADAAAAGTTSRNVANRLAAGGGWGGTNLSNSFAVGGAATGHLMGLDPTTSLAIGAGAWGIPPAVGGVARRIAEGATQRATSDAVRNIAGNSPLYQARLAASAPVTDARSYGRNMLALALLPQARLLGSQASPFGAVSPADAWGESWVPYENR